MTLPPSDTARCPPRATAARPRRAATPCPTRLEPRLRRWTLLRRPPGAHPLTRDHRRPARLAVTCRKEYTTPMLRTDLRLPTLPPLPALTAEEACQAAAHLHQIGWESEKLIQIAIYAQMPPAVKVAHMLRLRRQMVTLLRERIAHENPDFNAAACNAEVCARIHQYYAG